MLTHFTYHLQKLSGTIIHTLIMFAWQFLSIMRLMQAKQTTPQLLETIVF